jgi:hypothetical protein
MNMIFQQPKIPTTIELARPFKCNKPVKYPCLG